MTCPCTPGTYCAGRYSAEQFHTDDRMEQWLADPATAEDLPPQLRVSLGIYADQRQAAADHDRI